MASISRADSKLLPQSQEAEQAVLGSLLIDPDAILKVRQANLETRDFFSPANQVIYNAMLKLADGWQPIDMVVLTAALDAQHNGHGSQLEAVGGPAYLTQLISTTPTSVYVEHYAGMVKDTARRRRLIASASQIAAIASEHTGTIDELYNEASTLFFGAVDAAGKSSHMRGGDEALLAFLQQQVEREERYKERPDSYMGTGWLDLDNLLDYLEEGCLHVVSAQSSVGKTIYLEQIGEHNAKAGHQMVYYHLEQTHRNMLARAVVRYSGVKGVAGVDFKRISRGEHGPRVQAALDEINQWHSNMLYVHCPGWSAQRIVADMTRLTARGECDAAIVDYLQKVPLGTRWGENTAYAVEEVVETFKIAAETLNIPVVTASQVSRDWKRRADEKAVGDDSKGAGGIKDKANQLVVLNRKEKREETVRKGATTEIIEVTVDKNTNGPCGTVELVHLLGCLRFVDKAREEQHERDNDIGF